MSEYSPEFIVTQATTRPLARCLLAHGAGAPMDSDFMNDMAALIVQRGIEVWRFEFPYMQQRRVDGKKRPPDRQPKLLDAFRAAVSAMPSDLPLLLAGKSMGGRMASILMAQADQNGLEGVVGAVALGYPFHPPGKPEKLRTDHLVDMVVPLLVCQGERDTFGSRIEIEAMALPKQVQCCWLADGNHDLKPRKAAGISHEDNLLKATAAIDDFVRSLIKS